MGLNVIFGIDIIMGSLISGLISILIFWSKDAGVAMDWFAKALGFVMIALTLYVAVSSRPPVGAAIYHSFIPEKIDVMAVITLVGGTVGGYISFAGAHRLIDSGISGPAAIKQVTGSSVKGILITSLMRYVLFLAALGVVWKGAVLAADNPAGSVFQHASGNVGYRFFGFVMWCAAITSVVGASFTSVSFFKTLHPFLERNYRVVTTIFIITSLLIFLWLGNPVRLLILAGAVTVHPQRQVPFIQHG